MNPNGKGVTRLTHTKVDQLLQGLYPTEWSANGNRLLAQFEGQDTSYAVGVNVNTGAQRPILEATEQEWHQTSAVNGLGVLLGCQEAARAMIRLGSGGKIVNTASIAGRQGFAGLATYSASKFGVVALTQAAARALAEHRITVNAFAPGLVRTPMLEAIRDSPTERRREDLGGPLVGRESEPDDVVPAALFLSAADSDYLSGQVLPIDGGAVLV